jgi:hypothetical protein
MNTKFSDLITYFRTLAAQHVAIKHSETEKHFYRFEADEVFSGLKNVSYPALILEGYRYSFIDKQSDNTMKERSCAFMMLDHLSDIGDFDGMHDIWDRMEIICDDLIARIKSDKRNPNVNAVRDFDLNSVEAALIAAKAGNNFGIRITFTVTSPHNIDVDSTKWNLDVDVP